MHACKSWLKAERSVIDPQLTICLGATAAQSVMGRAVKINQERGKVLQNSKGRFIAITTHPSFVLRVPEGAAQEKAYSDLVNDLRLYTTSIGLNSPLTVGSLVE